MPVRTLPALLLTSVTLALAACGGREEAPPTRFTFTLRPPDGAVLVQRVIAERVQDLAGAPPLSERSESVVSLTFERIEAGYRVTARQISSKTMRDGKPIENEVSKLLQAKPASYEIDENGQVRAVRGFEDITQRIEAELPEGLSKVLKPVLTEELLVSRGRDEWNSRYGNFAGRSIEIGDIWTDPQVVELPGAGRLRQYTVTWFPMTRRCDERHCVRIRIFFNSDRALLVQELEAILGERAAKLFDDTPEEKLDHAAEGVTLSGEIDRLVDPSTLLPVHERHLKITTHIAPRPDGTLVPLTVTETKEYEFDLHTDTELNAAL
ncbi:MAG: hypothetical protein ACE5FG_06160 [Myxococcota bacterium]